MNFATKCLSIAAAATMVTAAAHARSGGHGHHHHNPHCKMRVVVEKVQPQHPGDEVTFNTTFFYKTPHMESFTQGSTVNFLEPQVNAQAISASNRICSAANNPNRLADPCAVTDLRIVGDLDGYGSFDCPTYNPDNGNND